jgi:predicted 3-demethylubiquinone-9 3-methyltransferase (glyoxalase superfamily)
MQRFFLLIHDEHQFREPLHLAAFCTHAISFKVDCADQVEVDRLWDALSDGGKVEQCGWLKDRYGVS